MNQIWFVCSVFWVFHFWRVVPHQDKLLRQWRYISVGKFCPNFFMSIIAQSPLKMCRYFYSKIILSRSNIFAKNSSFTWDLSTQYIYILGQWALSFFYIVIHLFPSGAEIKCRTCVSTAQVPGNCGISGHHAWHLWDLRSYV